MWKSLSFKVILVLGLINAINSEPAKVFCYYDSRSSLKEGMKELFIN